MPPFLIGLVRGVVSFVVVVVVVVVFFLLIQTVPRLSVNTVHGFCIKDLNLIKSKNRRGSCVNQELSTLHIRID